MKRNLVKGGSFKKKTLIFGAFQQIFVPSCFVKALELYVDGSNKIKVVLLNYFFTSLIYLLFLEVETIRRDHHD